MILSFCSGAKSKYGLWFPPGVWDGLGINNIAQNAHIPVFVNWAGP
jgi:hypothetical protein